MAELSKKSILIIDSDEQSLNNIANGLKENGYLVITAPDGFSGYNRGSKENPDIVIANDLLPYISGYKISKLLKSDDRHKNTKIIIMSTSSGATIDKLFNESKADNFLEKPFQLKEILEIIK